VWEEHTPLRFDWWECSWVETKNISFILVSKYKLLLSREPLSFIFDYLPSAYLIAHNCGMTWRFWLFNSVVSTFVRIVKHFDISIYTSITNTHIHPLSLIALKRSPITVSLLSTDQTTSEKLHSRELQTKQHLIINFFCMSLLLSTSTGTLNFHPARLLLFYWLMP